MCHFCHKYADPNIRNPAEAVLQNAEEHQLVRAGTIRALSRGMS
jgi:hypothetical protein